MQAVKQKVNMIQGPLMKKIIVFAVPLIISGMLQLLFNAADMIVVGKFSGDAAMAAIGATSSLCALIVNLFMGLSLGVSVVIARSIGAKQYEYANQAVHTAIILAVLCGLSVSLIGYFGARSFLFWMGTPATLIDQSVTYLRIFFFSSPFAMLYNFGAAVLRAGGDTVRPMVFLLIAGVLNVAGNLITVIVMRMGVAGVAVATLLSQAIAAVLILIALRGNGTIKLKLRALKIEKRTALEILRIGLPAGVQSSLFALSNVFIQGAVNAFGEVTVAANAASANLEGFTYAAMTSFSHAAVAFTGQNHGAKKPERVRRVLLCCCVLAMTIGLAVGLLFLFLSKYLLGLYTNSPEVVEIARLRIGIICPTYFLCGIMESVSGTNKGMGKAFVPMFLSLFGACFLRILWIYTVFPLYPLLPFLYACYPVTWTVTILLQGAYFLLVYRRIDKRKQAAEQACAG